MKNNNLPKQLSHRKRYRSWDIMYFDLCKDIKAALLLSQITYWFSPGDNGCVRAKYIYEGRRCIIKKHEDWWAECRLTAREYERAIKILCEKGYVTTEVHYNPFTPKKQERATYLFLNEDILSKDIESYESREVFDDKFWSDPSEFSQNYQKGFSENTQTAISENCGDFTKPPIVGLLQTNEKGICTYRTDTTTNITYLSSEVENSKHDTTQHNIYNQRNIHSDKNSQGSENKRSKKSAVADFCSPDGERLFNIFLSKILSFKPDFKKPNSKKWIEEFDKMLRIDKRSVEKSIEIINWALDHKFWRRNIKSPEKLRKQFDHLEIQMMDESKESEAKKNRDYATHAKYKNTQILKFLWIDKNYVGHSHLPGKELPLSLPCEQFKEQFNRLFKIVPEDSKTFPDLEENIAFAKDLATKTFENISISQGNDILYLYYRPEKGPLSGLPISLKQSKNEVKSQVNQFFSSVNSKQQPRRDV